MKFISRFFSSIAVKVDDGRAQLIKGKLEKQILREVSALCQEIGIDRCELWVDGMGKVTFSSEVPKQAYQKFRNVVVVNY